MGKNTDEPADFAELLRETRRHAGLTHTELARRSGLSRQRIRQLEAGRSARVSAEDATSLAATLFAASADATSGSDLEALRAAWARYAQAGQDEREVGPGSTAVPDSAQSPITDQNDLPASAEQVATTLDDDATPTQDAQPKDKPTPKKRIDVGIVIGGVALILEAFDTVPGGRGLIVVIIIIAMGVAFAINHFATGRFRTLWVISALVMVVVLIIVLFIFTRSRSPQAGQQPQPSVSPSPSPSPSSASIPAPSRSAATAPPVTTADPQPLKTACRDLRKAAGDEVLALQALQKSVHLVNGRVVAYSPSGFEQAYRAAVNKVWAAKDKLATFYDLDGSLPKDSKFDSDLSELARSDLNKLYTGTRAGGGKGAYDALNQMVDYIDHASQIQTKMRCPA